MALCGCGGRSSGCQQHCGLAVHASGRGRAATTRCQSSQRAARCCCSRWTPAGRSSRASRSPRSRREATCCSGSMEASEQRSGTQQLPSNGHDRCPGPLCGRRGRRVAAARAGGGAANGAAALLASTSFGPTSFFCLGRGLVQLIHLSLSLSSWRHRVSRLGGGWGAQRRGVAAGGHVSTAGSVGCGAAHHVLAYPPVQLLALLRQALQERPQVRRRHRRPRSRSSTLVFSGGSSCGGGVDGGHQVVHGGHGGGADGALVGACSKGRLGGRSSVLAGCSSMQRARARREHGPAPGSPCGSSVPASTRAASSSE